MAVDTTPPRKSVQWDLDTSASSLGSPATPLQDTSPASWNFVNSQLVAHGFTHAPGVQIDGLSPKDQQALIKCLMGMLGQRMDDMARTEDIGTKLRTLSYEYERQLEKTKVANETAAHAEREREAAKVRLAHAEKQLSSSEKEHKTTRENMQRLNNAFLALRAQHASEMKRKEKEVEKVMERWQKIANDQIRLGSVGSGLACSNPTPESHVPKENNFLQVALAQSEATRTALLEENFGLRDVLLSAANALQTLIHASATLLRPTEDLGEPSLLSATDLFSPSTSNLPAPANVQMKLRELFTTLRDELPKLAAFGRDEAATEEKADPEEITRLQDAIEKLELELREARMTVGQQLLDRFLDDDRFVSGSDPEPEDPSLELIAAPEEDEIRKTLDAQKRALVDERTQFTEAAIQLGKERAAIEIERLHLMEEKRALRVQTMLNELPPSSEPAVVKVKTPRASRKVRSGASLKKRISTRASTKTKAREDEAEPKIAAFELPVESALPSESSKTVASLEPESIIDTKPDSTKPITSDDESLLDTAPPDFESMSPYVPRDLEPITPGPKTPRTLFKAPLRHKFAPAIPSPLSRMVTIADTPPSPPRDSPEQSEPESKEPSPLTRIMALADSPKPVSSKPVSSFPGLFGPGISRTILATAKADGSGSPLREKLPSQQVAQRKSTTAGASRKLPKPVEEDKSKSVPEKETKRLTTRETKKENGKVKTTTAVKKNKENALTPPVTTSSSTAAVKPRPPVDLKKSLATSTGVRSSRLAASVAAPTTSTTRRTTSSSGRTSATTTTARSSGWRT